ncbi:MAG: carbon-nitrogen hydrolase family protein [Promethearchaeota archaeon]
MTLKCPVCGMRIQTNQIKSRTPPEFIEILLPHDGEGIKKLQHKELVDFWCPQCNSSRTIEMLIREIHRGTQKSHIPNDPSSYRLMQLLMKYEGKEMYWTTAKNKLEDNLYEYLRFGYLEVISEGFKPRLKTWQRRFIRVNPEKIQTWIEQYFEFRYNEIRSLLEKFRSEATGSHVSEIIDYQLTQLSESDEIVIQDQKGNIFTKLDISNRGYDEFLGLLLLVAQQIDERNYITVEELGRKYREKINGTNFSYQLSRLRKLLGNDLTPYFILEIQPLRLIPVNLCQKPISSVKVGLFPLWTTRNDYLSNGRYKNESRIDKRQKIITVIDGASKKGLNFIVFPELALPWPDPDLYSFAFNKGIGIIGGLEYHHEDGLRNKCIIQLQNGRQFFQNKQFRSKYDLNGMVEGESVKLFHGTSWGDFSVLICFDLTDIGLLAELRGKIDFIVVPTYNPAVGTFENIQKAISYLNYCFIIIVNSAEFGKTQVVGPLKGQENIVVGFLEEHKEELLIIDLPISELRNAKVGKSKKFQSEPAGFPWEKINRKIISI